MSSAASREIQRLGRASAVGVFNSLLGYSVIFGAMALGLSPYVSNLLGYCLGFFCSFVLYRKIVFHASGNATRQIRFFLFAFLLSYLMNFIALYELIRFGVGALIAQLSSAAIYFLCMYAISRIWVFSNQD